MKNPTQHLLLSAFLALLIPLGMSAGTTIKGKITEDGKRPPVLAHVHLFPLSHGIGMESLQTVEVGSDGSYKLTVDEPGYYRLAVTAVNHDYLSVPILVSDDDRALQLDISPAMLAWNREPEELMIIGSWNNFDFQSAEPMKREKDGSFSYTFESSDSEVLYQIINLATTSDGNIRSVNAPGSSSYVYDGGGDYRSVMKAKPGEKVTIRFDLQNLPQTGTSYEPVVKFNDDFHEQLREIDYVYNTTSDQFMFAAMKAREEGTSLSPAEIWRPFYQVAEEFLSDDNKRTIRQFAALNIAKTLKFAREPEQLALDEETLEMVQKLLPADDPIWAADPHLASRVVLIDADSPEERMEAMEELYKKNPDHVVRGIALSNMVAMEEYEGNHEKAKELYKELASEYGELEEVSYILAEYNPDRSIQVGKEVPDFEVVLISNGDGGTTQEVVSRESMKGRYYLIDFWATWCGPCVGEMPGLHAAYKKFGGDDFEVLSLSFDSAPDKVVEFRKDKWDMPWLNTFVQGGFNSELAKNFEVKGIPKPILVGPDGKIVATESELRGAKLEETLARVLGDGQAAR